jgi:hypothetical protein
MGYHGSEVGLKHGQFGQAARVIALDGQQRGPLSSNTAQF